MTSIVLYLLHWQTLHVNQRGISRLKFKRKQTLLASLPSLSYSLPSPPFPPFPSLYQLGCLGSALSSPVGSGAKPQPLNNLVHIWAKRNGPGDNQNRIKISSVFWNKRVSQFCRQLAWTTNKIWRVWWEALCWWEAWGPGPLPPLNPAMCVRLFNQTRRNNCLCQWDYGKYQ